MSDQFRELLKKVGSGTHTHKHLSREEAATALDYMLTQRATPAQIGAFLIAHRIRRPTSPELAGMLDIYHRYGPQLQPVASDYPALVMGIPYDGRSRTAPLAPLTALVVAAAGGVVIHHGGAVMPTKYGIPLVEVWQSLGVDWRGLTLGQVQQVLESVGLGFLYTPHHFPLATTLIPYREQIGKRPPLATLELMWCPYGGAAIVALGYVHPPTEDLIRGALALHQTPAYVLVKGLEGSCDLPRDRTVIAGVGAIQGEEMTYDRLFLRAKDYGYGGPEVALPSGSNLAAALEDVVQGGGGPWRSATVWNSGFYLWQVGISRSLEAGLALADTLLSTGAVAQRLEALRACVVSR
jgi:anthranilate phosphoribosyltransferase